MQNHLLREKRNRYSTTRKSHPEPISIGETHCGVPFDVLHLINTGTQIMASRLITTPIVTLRIFHSPSDACRLMTPGIAAKSVPFVKTAFTAFFAEMRSTFLSVAFIGLGLRLFSKLFTIGLLFLLNLRTNVKTPPLRGSIAGVGHLRAGACPLSARCVLFYICSARLGGVGPATLGAPAVLLLQSR